MTESNSQQRHAFDIHASILQTSMYKQSVFCKLLLIDLHRQPNWWIHQYVERPNSLFWTIPRSTST